VLWLRGTWIHDPDLRGTPGMAEVRDESQQRKDLESFDESMDRVVCIEAAFRRSMLPVKPSKTPTRRWASSRGERARRRANRGAGSRDDDLLANPARSAVVGVSTLLDRLDALESAPERKATRKADHAAFATLASRGYTAEERARLRGLVGLTQTVIMTKPVSDAEREQTLNQLYAWYNEWSTSARLALTRRDHQIAVGIAKRRKPKKDEAPRGPDAPAATKNVP
jgi:hypothetical protein